MTADHDLAELVAAFERSEELLTRLHERLEREAGERDLVDVCYRLLDSPAGPLLLAATDHGLIRVAYEPDHEQALAELADTVGPRILASESRLEPVAQQFLEYFDRRRRRFELELDLRLAHGFRRQVLDHLVDIGYGDRETYAEVAAASGHPRAFRAVGTACARNPLPVVVPCHRVVRSDGTPGPYVGGAQVKELLLDLEAVA